MYRLAGPGRVTGALGERRCLGLNAMIFALVPSSLVLRTHAGKPAVNLVAGAGKTMSIRPHDWPQQLVLGGSRLNLLHGVEAVAESSEPLEVRLPKVV